MKIRSDFVTNSSSASFILELTFEANDGECACMHLAVSPEICRSDDGDMIGYAIYLNPKKKKNETPPRSPILPQKISNLPLSSPTLPHRFYSHHIPGQKKPRIHIFLLRD